MTTHSPLRATMADTERAIIVQALADARGSRLKAAAALGISIRSLFLKIKLYRIPAHRRNAP